MTSSQAPQASPTVAHSTVLSLLVLVLPFVLLPFTANTEAAVAGHHCGAPLRSQAAALLQWKFTLKGKNMALLSSWSAHIHPCHWTGVTCSGVGCPHRPQVITGISLQGAGLVVGQLDTLDLLSLPDITTLNLSSNQLAGSIPATVGELRRLAVLDLSYNSLSGHLPVSLGNLTQLTTLSLSSKMLYGHIPCQLGLLSHLLHLDFYGNNLTGSIPSSTGNLTRLTYLDLSRNDFTGSIPREIGNPKKLTNLVVSHNLLTGFVPSSIVNLTALQILGLGVNKIGGSVLDKVVHLVNLKVLNIRNNEFIGTIPSSIRNLTSIERINLGYNNFTGQVPPSLGDLSPPVFLSLAKNQLSGIIPVELGNLTNLEYIWVYLNRLSGSIPESFGNLKNMMDMRLFASDLSRCLPQVLSNLTHLVIAALSRNSFTGQLPNLCEGKILRHFNINNNMFHGPVPESFRHCTSLEFLSCSKNQLDGYLSQCFGIYPHLVVIDLSRNNFYGHLSPNWGKCYNLTTLWMNKNMITGSIPLEFSKLIHLAELKLHSNMLTGEIPVEIGDLMSLYKLNLRENLLFGTLPPQIGQLSNLEQLDLSTNRLNGTIPKELADCQKLISVKFNNNNLTGNLPRAIGSMINLQIILDLSNNNLNGAIPQELGNLEFLEFLNLSHNQFSGGIPSSVTSMRSLSVFDVSYNNLEGPVPNKIHNASQSWFLHNKGLCGTYFGLPPCYSPPGNKHGKQIHRNLILATGIILFFAIVSLITSIIVLYIRQKKDPNDRTRQNFRDVFSIWNFDGKLAFEDIISATENFDEKYCVGIGGYGSVYKAQLQAGRVVAVKKLHSTGEWMDDAMFHREVEVLMKIRHRSIVKLHGFCSHDRYKFFVHDYIERRSLAAMLCNQELSSELHWQRRITLINDVAQAISYLHHDCDPPIVHRDITSGNILLDAEYRAFLSDFGTARIIKTNSSNWSELAGTYGYIAPEFSYKSVVTEKCDVYSFSVVIMEVVMGKHPGDLISYLTSVEEQDLSFEGIMDKHPFTPTSKEEQDIIRLISIPSRCMQASPQDRPTMQQVYQALYVVYELFS